MIIGYMQRWKSDSPGYKLAEHNVQRRKQSVIKQKVEVCVRERWFLLAVKAKYAGITEYICYAIMLSECAQNRWACFSFSTFKTDYNCIFTIKKPYKAA